MGRARLTFDDYVQGIRNGDKLMLSRAITLVESKLGKDIALADRLVNALLPFSGNAVRIGITGVPGAGKSTFIEAFGTFITALPKKIAVLTIDPSSKLSGGSILGDKTRMDKLSRDPLAFIRPSPAGNEMGGVAGKTLENIILCEAAGFEVIIIETVGVGQSETLVKDMVDFFLLLLLTGAGDELQGIKRGIMEMADAVVINKADGENLAPALATKKQLEHALHLFPSAESGWQVPVLASSSLSGKGIEEIWGLIEKYRQKTQKNGFWQHNRELQQLSWFRKTLEALILHSFYHEPDFLREIKQVEEKVKAGHMNPGEGATYLFNAFKTSK